MLELLFWAFFLIAYGGFSVWLAKAVLHAIFLAVSRGARAPAPVQLTVRRDLGA